MINSIHVYSMHSSDLDFLVFVFLDSKREVKTTIITLKLRMLKIVFYLLITNLHIYDFLNLKCKVYIFE